MFRRPLFWLLLAAVSLVSSFFVTRYFSRAFPIVTLDLRMSRQEALQEAREIASSFQLTSAEYQEVASFGNEQLVQNFIELEGGGTEALKAIIDEGLYHPFTWTVRHFKPGETREVQIFFTPIGDRYGFVVRLPEAQEGAALDADSALEIAESAAAQSWQIDFDSYELVEKSRVIRPGGRIDHTFVYEMSDARVGEARYRLRLVIAGDKLTELRRYMKIPEAFSRRYEEMRSANEVIGVSGSMGLIVLYIIGGCGFGLFYLMRQGWILWRIPLFWGLLIAFLQLLDGINGWPLLWMSYDTAISSQGFIMQQLMQLLLIFLLYAFLFSLSFMAAESLSRRAFPHHIQQWKLWSAGVANSKAVLGRTVGGYLLVGLFFAYEVILYFVTTRSLGWWTPSDALVKPDILATYFPWLSSIAVSAQAGFFEECLCRAVPIAGAALLGSRYGGRKWWIAAAVIIQAIIFGAGHAAYANQPSYARVVELIIPSLMFAGLYLRFGLLPAIVLHYTYDVVWLALPLFVSSAPGIWVNRIFVIALVFVPLWVVLVARLRARTWGDVSQQHLNAAWQPRREVKKEEETEVPTKAVYVLPAAVKIIPIAGLAGLTLWITISGFKSDSPPLNISRGGAQDLAAKTLKENKIELPPSWKVLTSLDAQPGQQDRFVWQTAGKEIYGSLLKEYITPPHWRVRFVQFEGDVAERAEEYQVFVSDPAQAFRFRHLLPEARAAKSFAENDARLLAQRALESEFQIDWSDAREISAVSSKLKSRTDWIFTFEEEGGQTLSQGEKRIAIRISGEEVVDAYRFVYVPEEWDREERDKQTIPMILNVACLVIILLTALAGAATAIFNWSRGRFNTRTFLLIFGLLAILQLTSLMNSLPSYTSQFSTAQPYKIQLFISVLSVLISAILLSACIGLIAGILHHWCSTVASLPRKTALVIGLSLGGIVAGLSALASSLGPSLSPVWPDFSSLNSFMPFLQIVVAPVGGFLIRATIVLLVIVGIDRLTSQWRKRKILFGSLLVLFGFAMAGSGSVATVYSWLLSGSMIGCFLLASYILMLRFSLPATVIAVGIVDILAILKQGIYAAYPDALVGAIISAILVAAAAWFFCSKLPAKFSY